MIDIIFTTINIDITFIAHNNDYVFIIVYYKLTSYQKLTPELFYSCFIKKCLPHSFN